MTTCPLYVRPIAGMACCYYVESISRPGDPYVVDLLENEGKGVCNCPDFQSRRQKRIDAGDEAFTPTTQCKHLDAAANYWKRTTLQDMARSCKRPNYQTHIQHLTGSPTRR